jgi:sulfoxide reductase heme-binding subunit YedZ
MIKNLALPLTNLTRPTSQALTVKVLKISVHLGAWLALAWLVWDAASGNLTVNPIQAATQRTGRYAIVFLGLSLACTPLNTIFGLRAALAVRRLTGLYAFLFASLHFTIFAWLDYGLDLGLLQEAILDKRYTLIGMLAFLILSALAFTSFKVWQKRLGKKWKRLHQLVYLASILLVFHFAWAKKGDLFRLQGEIWQPLMFGIAVTTLLVLRLPQVRRKVVQARAAYQRRKHSNPNIMTP